MSTTVTLPESLHAQVRALAERTGRTVAQGLAYERWFREEVEEALRSTASGHFVSPAEVEAMWSRITTPEAIAQAEAELDEAGLA
ncbi:MAG TPA: hypothetical protein VN837_00060 [Chloroflexota bacterium]|nr:hypothetical protein [Chloroflexota bacterium]